MLEEIVDDDLRVRIALEVNDNARVFVRLIADRADVRDDLVVHQIRDARDEYRAVHVVRNLRDNQLLASALHFYHADLAAHPHRSFSRVEVALKSRRSENLASRREIRAFHMLHQPVNRDVRVVNLRADAVNDFGQIVRRHVRRHADRDAGAAIHEQIRERRRQHRRLGARLVVVRDEIHGVLFHVVHQRRAEVLQARLGVTHGRRRVALDAAEIPLPLDEHFAHRPRLRHVDERRVNRLVAVRVIVAHRLADDLRALQRLARRRHAQLGHRKKNAALRGLQPITRIRQRAGNDDGHRVVEERLRHLLGNVDRLNFFVLVIHR